MNADEKNLVDSYDKGDSLIHKDIARSLTIDFPKSMRKMGLISNCNVCEINQLLYDEEHEESQESYIECLQQFVNNPPSFVNNPSVDGKERILEIIEACLSDVESLHGRIRKIIDIIDTDKADENFKQKNPIDTAKHLDGRLTAIIDRAKLIQFTELEVERIKGSVEKFKNDLSSSSDAIDNLKKDVSMANKDMVAVMGIFTSIIVVIMSLVITSSSWLNNAYGASAIIAFVIPSCVAVLAVCALTAFLKLLIKDEMGKFIPWIVVTVLTLIVGCVTIWKFGNKEVASHNRLIFDVDKYSTVDPNDATAERIINIDFTEKIIMSDGEHDVEVVIENQKESDCLIHNGLIYYCTTHSRFE